MIERLKDHVFGGAINRTQGWTLMATLGYQAKLLVKHPRGDATS